MKNEEEKADLERGSVTLKAFQWLETDEGRQAFLAAHAQLDRERVARIDRLAEPWPPIGDIEEHMQKLVSISGEDERTIRRVYLAVIAYLQRLNGLVAEHANQRLEQANRTCEPTH